MTKILIAVTSTGSYASGLPADLWLSEVTHLYNLARREGFSVTVASPKGSTIPVGPDL